MLRVTDEHFDKQMNPSSSHKKEVHRRDFSFSSSDDASIDFFNGLLE